LIGLASALALIVLCLAASAHGVSSAAGPAAERKHRILADLPLDMRDATGGDRGLIELIAKSTGQSLYEAVWRRAQKGVSATGGWCPQPVGVGVGKRRWYATIFSFERPRSRSISTERRGRSLSGRSTMPDIVTHPFSTSTFTRCAGTARSRYSAFNASVLTSSLCDMIVTLLPTSLSY